MTVRAAVDSTSTEFVDGIVGYFNVLTASSVDTSAALNEPPTFQSEPASITVLSGLNVK